MVQGVDRVYVLGRAVDHGSEQLTDHRSPLPPNVRQSR